MFFSADQSLTIPSWAALKTASVRVSAQPLRHDEIGHVIECEGSALLIIIHQGKYKRLRFACSKSLGYVLLSDIDLAPVEDRIKPILRYARKLTLSPARMTEADASAIYEAGWGDNALYSTVLVTALFNFYNRLVDGVGLALPEGYVAEAAKRLSTQGYDVFAQIAKA